MIEQLSEMTGQLPAHLCITGSIWCWWCADLQALQHKGHRAQVSLNRLPGFCVMADACKMIVLYRTQPNRFNAIFIEQQIKMKPFSINIFYVQYKQEKSNGNFLEIPHLDEHRVFEHSFTLSNDVIYRTDVCLERQGYFF